MKDIPVNTVRFQLPRDTKGKPMNLFYVRRFQRVRVTFSGDGPSWVVGNRERLVERWNEGKLPDGGTAVESALVNGVDVSGIVGGGTLGDVMRWLSDYGNDIPRERRS